MLLNQPYLPQATTATRRAHRSLPRILLCPEYCSVQNTALPGILICLRYLNFLAYFAICRTNYTYPKPPPLLGVLTDHCQEYYYVQNTAPPRILLYLGYLNLIAQFAMCRTNHSYPLQHLEYHSALKTKTVWPILNIPEIRILPFSGMTSFHVFCDLVSKSQLTTVLIAQNTSLPQIPKSSS